MPPLMHRNAALTALGFATAALTATGCGPTCYTACGKLYREECNISAPGQTQSELLSDCVDTCQAALNNPGEVGDYDPFEPTSSTNAITIDTDRQAALWMDCVDQSSCENIKGDQNNDGVTDSKKMCLPHF
ncbi:MAG: hypothetical protein GXP62_15705 [Oligoflexia bacterium]|nr:hypothetical protein [Oligoflexia bacterium]